MIEGNIAYIRINKFSPKTGRELKRFVKKILKKNPEGIVLDLLNNPGGSLKGAVRVLKNFLKKGDLIIYTMAKNKKRKDFFSNVDGKLHNSKVVVLVNGRSSSGSEVVAGVLSDYGVAKIIGNKTWGKGVVLNSYIVSNGSILKLVTDYWYTHKGRNIDKVGLALDIVTKEGDELSRALLEFKKWI